MRYRWAAVLASLLCTGTACYKLRRPPTADDAGVATGAAGAQPDPFEASEGCAVRGLQENPGDGLCAAGKLEVNCNQGPPRLDCPGSFEEAARWVCRGADAYVTYCNACGGSSIRLPQGTFVFETHFSAGDELLGMTLIHDAPVAPCEQHEFVFGRHCSPAGPQRVVPCSPVRVTASH